jgi:hypothetical protein
MSRVGWTQPLCEPCFAAWELGNGRKPREPVRLRGDAEEDGDPCVVCGTPTTIYTRIDPALVEGFRYAMVKDD